MVHQGKILSLMRNHSAPSGCMFVADTKKMISRTVHSAADIVVCSTTMGARPYHHAIGEQQLLLELSKPLDACSGRTWAGPVYTFHQHQRKTRSEIAIAVDGESVGLYSVMRVLSLFDLTD